MKIKSSFVIIFIVSLLFSQEEIIHINKTHRDGTPKEVIIYEIINDDLQSNNPFSIVEKISYDSKGNYVKPKLKGATKKIVGQWMNDEKQFGFLIIADGIIKEIEKGEVGGNEGTWELNDKKPYVFKILEDDKVVVEFDITFVTDNEVEFAVKGKNNDKILLKRKKK
jgi:hypothetical protein